LFGQIDVGFVKHLSEHHLSTEHLEYIKSCESSEDSLEFFKAKYYIQCEQDSLFFESFRKSTSLIFSDTLFVNFLNNYFLLKKEKVRNDWFVLSDSLTITDSVHVNFYYHLAKSPILSDSTFLPDELRVDFVKYAKAYKKKPGVALVLSMLVPGLGELYIGNLRASLAKFGSQSIFGAQIIESVKVLGILHPLPILNIGFFSAFYVANIVGSYRDAKTKKNDLKNQYLYHVSEYNSHLHPASIY
jgi:hypothetical protein